MILVHPDVAARSCSDCVKYLYYDQGPGKFGARVERGGKPVLRPKGVAPPCKWCPKIFPGDEPVPGNAQELTPDNEQAVDHFKRCRAVGRFPDDAIVARNAALVRDALDHADRVHQTRVGLTVLHSLASGG